MGFEWTNKIDGVDDAVADDVNTLAAAIKESETKIESKADKYNYDNGFNGGLDAWTAGAGGAIGAGSKTNNGGAAGAGADSGMDSQVEVTQRHVTQTVELLMRFSLAQVQISMRKTLQIYGYQLMDANGNIPNERISAKADKSDTYTKTEIDTGFTDVANAVETKADKDDVPQLDGNRKIPNEYLYGKTVKEYGIRWLGTSSTVCERLGDAVGLVANAHLGNTNPVINDFDNIYPWSDMRLCNLDESGNVLAYIGEPNFARDGSNGDVMVEIPKFYYKRRKVGIVEEWWICELPIGGYELHPLFIDGGIEMSKAYMSAYNLSESADGTKGQSISGGAPKVRATRAAFRTLARAKGVYMGYRGQLCRKRSSNALHGRICEHQLAINARKWNTCI